MKDLKPPKDPVELMGQAYERLLETAMEDARKLEKKTGPALHELIDKAREKLSELGEFTEEELEKVSEYLKRDLRDAAEFLAETGQEFRDWLGFETRLVGERFAELLAQAADQTLVQLELLREQAELAGYHTGEITGPGVLVCDRCGEELHFHKPGRIPPCPRCGGTSFHRKRG